MDILTCDCLLGISFLILCTHPDLKLEENVTNCFLFDLPFKWSDGQTDGQTDKIGRHKFIDLH